MTDSADRKHAATPQRRRRALEAGQTARSQDLSSHCVLIVALLVLWWSGPGVMHALQSIMETCLSAPMIAADSMEIGSLVASCAVTCIQALLPLLAACCVVSCLASALQNGFLFSPKGLSFDMERLNPTTRLTSLLQWHTFLQLGIAMLRFVVVCGTFYVCLTMRWDKLQTMLTLPLRESAQLAWTLLMELALTLAALLFAFSLLDYALQWWRHEQSLRMSDEDLREENKAVNNPNKNRVLRRVT